MIYEEVVCKSSRLKTYCTVTSSKRIYASDYVDSGVPFVRGKEVVNNFSNPGPLDSELYITRNKFEQLRDRFGAPVEGDLLLTSVGTLGILYLVKSDDEFYFKDGNLIWFKDFNGLNSCYLYYWLQAPSGCAQLNKCTIGTSQSAYTIERIKEIEVDLPSVDIQQRVAEILSAYDNMIFKNRRRMALLEKAAHMIYQEWFVRLRFPGHEKTRIVDGVPEGWDFIPFSKLAVINPHTPINKSDEHMWVEMGDLATNSMVISATSMCSRGSGSKFMDGDTLLARITPCLENGKTGFVNFLGKSQVGLGSTEFIVIRAVLVPATYVYCMARSYELREHAIKSMVGSSGRQRVQRCCFDDLYVYEPSPSVQLDFAERTEPIFELIGTLHNENRKLQQARDIILPKLMSGEIEI